MKTLASVFAAAGLFMLGYWTVECVSARLFQARAVRELPAAVERRAPRMGSAIAKIEIPRLQMSAVVVEGADASALRLGPGHIPGTAMPGEGANTAIAGHRDTFFRVLRLAHKHDDIELTVRGRKFGYEVVSTEVVAPDDVQVLRPAGHESLTLITCYPFYFVGAAPKRFVVRAERVE